MMIAANTVLLRVCITWCDFIFTKQIYHYLARIFNTHKDVYCSAITSLRKYEIGFTETYYIVYIY